MRSYRRDIRRSFCCFCYFVWAHIWLCRPRLVTKHVPGPLRAAMSLVGQATLPLALLPLQIWHSHTCKFSHKRQFTPPHPLSPSSATTYSFFRGRGNINELQTLKMLSDNIVTWTRFCIVSLLREKDGPKDQPGCVKMAECQTQALVFVQLFIT